MKAVYLVIVILVGYIGVGAVGFASGVKYGQQHPQHVWGQTEWPSK